MPNSMVTHSQSPGDVASPTGSFTFREILQQPTLWPTTIEVVRRNGWVTDTPKGPAILTGAGTSAYAAAAIADVWPNAQAVPTTDLLIESLEQLERRSPEFAKDGLLISIGRSGDSPESIAVVERIKRLCPAVSHIAITCNAKGHLANTAGVQAIVLDPRTNDRSLAMTSSFSNLVLAGLSLQRARELEHAIGTVCADVERRLPELDAHAQRLAAQPVERVVVLGSGSFRSLASEACLKILEMTAGRTATLPETFLGLRHGPMSFLRPDTLVLCFLSASEEQRRYEEDLLRELRQKKIGHIVGIAPPSADRDLFDVWIPANAPQLPDELRTPFEIPFAQLLAYHLSVCEGLDPDNPSPTGAITRVVQKFDIHDENSRV